MSKRKTTQSKFSNPWLSAASGSVYFTPPNSRENVGIDLRNLPPYVKTLDIFIYLPGQITPRRIEMHI